LSSRAASLSPRANVAASRSSTGSCFDQIASKAGRLNDPAVWRSHCAAWTRTAASDGADSVPNVSDSLLRRLSAARAGPEAPRRTAERTASPHPVFLSIQTTPLRFGEGQAGRDRSATPHPDRSRRWSLHL